MEHCYAIRNAFHHYEFIYLELNNASMDKKVSLFANKGDQIPENAMLT